MRTAHTQSPNLNILDEGKDKYFHGQLEAVYKAFQEKPMTMKEADVYTGVMRENICRYVDTLLEHGKIAVLKQRRCTITGYPTVNEYTGNPALFPKPQQLSLF